jgi:FixJ family two-component response regulator
VVSVVDDDELTRNALLGLFKAAGLRARVFAWAKYFLAFHSTKPLCLIANVCMPGISPQASLGRGDI